RDIGPLSALGFYRTMLEQTILRLGRDPRWRTWLAVTPDSAARAAAPWAHGVPRLKQGKGDLGRRMVCAVDRLPPGPAVIVGTDIPDLAARHVADAFRALRAHD